MGCEDCIHLKHHRPCPMSSFHNGTGDGDPYDYWYCRKGHWAGDENDADNCAVSGTEPAEPFSADTCPDYCPPRED